MQFAEYDDSFLLTRFREFYAEAIRLERLVKTGTWVFLPEVTFDPIELRSESLSGAPSQALDLAVAEQQVRNQGIDSAVVIDQAKLSTVVWQRLLCLFDRQVLAAYAHGGTFGAEIYREAQYVMVALADEIFLNLDWEGRHGWVSNLLESRIFRSHVAGELFFDKLDRLLQDRDPYSRDLAVIYLLALGLGFKGKFRDIDDRGQLARYRHLLFSVVFRRKPDLGDPAKFIFPDAYVHTLRPQKRKKLPNPRIWLGVLLLIIVGYAIVSHSLWHNLTSRLNELNNEISAMWVQNEGASQ